MTFTKGVIWGIIALIVLSIIGIDLMYALKP